MRKVKGRWSQGGKSILFNPNTLIFSFARNSKHIDLVACFVQSYKEIVFACKQNLARTQMNHKVEIFPAAASLSVHGLNTGFLICVWLQDVAVWVRQ